MQFFTFCCLYTSEHGIILLVETIVQNNQTSDMYYNFSKKCLHFLDISTHCAHQWKPQIDLHDCLIVHKINCSGASLLHRNFPEGKNEIEGLDQTKKKDKWKHFFLPPYIWQHKTIEGYTRLESNKVTNMHP